MNSVQIKVTNPSPEKKIEFKEEPKILYSKNTEILVIDECTTVKNTCDTICDSTEEIIGPDCDSTQNANTKEILASINNNYYNWPPWARYLKLGILLSCWGLCSVALITRNEHTNTMHQLSIPPYRHSRGYFLSVLPSNKKQMTLYLKGALLPTCYGNLSKNWISVWVELVELNYVPEKMLDISFSDIDYIRNVTQEWRFPIVSSELIGFVPEITKHKIFEFNSVGLPKNSISRFRLKFHSNLRVVFPISFLYHFSTIDIEEGVLYGAILLSGLYVMIIFELVHRTLAAMLASTMAVAILAALNDRPSIKLIISWIDIETILLLFSMMILVAIFSDTGVFDYMAVAAYQITDGQVWPLITVLCFFTALLSSFLDNVTTVLLMTPITIRLCEVMQLYPVKVLMIMVIYSNIGGALTPIGDPPNVIITTNPSVIRSGVNFFTFFLHMGIGVVLSTIVIYIYLRLTLTKADLLSKDNQEVQDLKHELAIWQKTVSSLSSYSKNEDIVRESLMTKINRLLSELKVKMTESNSTTYKHSATLDELKEKYPIRDKELLIKSGFTLFVVILVFFLHAIPVFARLGLGWTALLGVMLLLLISDRGNFESVLLRVEWSTLLFFASLFILMEALSKLGFIDWIGEQTQSVILAVDKENQLAVAILLILWVSAAASAFVDNIPLTTMMVRIAISLNDNRDLNLPLQPLIWALSFGACLGGNGTLFGASANVICAGVAEQHGYKFSFIDFFKLGFPIMLVSMIVTTTYLIIAHVVLEWNY
ncbi:P protein [Chrysoperla carnea]|uniref:P protein n=1 Tax=Chrysoperla carnea TaxID=189513 RepID=UPI001D082945|nr:P protein [Chrysoperla carnea]